MALFNWSSGYSVNIKEIDDQHRVLIDLINKLHDAMKIGKGKDVIGPILNELVIYTKFHFTHEEKLFSGNSYPETSMHKLEHAKLVKQVDELSKNFNGGQEVMSMDIMNFLKDWLANHIMGTDKKYSGFLNTKGIY